MRLITIEKIYEGMMIPKVWFGLFFWLRRLSSPIESIAITFYIPWIFNGPYYDPMMNFKRFGWRIPRVLFQINFSSPIFRKFFWYEAI